MEWFIAYLTTTPVLMAGAFVVGALMGRPFMRLIPVVREFFPKSAD